MKGIPRKAARHVHYKNKVWRARLSWVFRARMAWWSHLQARTDNEIVRKHVHVRDLRTYILNVRKYTV